MYACQGRNKRSTEVAERVRIRKKKKNVCGLFGKPSEDVSPRDCKRREHEHILFGVKKKRNKKKKSKESFTFVEKKIIINEKNPSETQNSQVHDLQVYDRLSF